jgi:hypothetical protein
VAKTTNRLTFGDRLRTLRLSLDHGKAKELPQAAMDRAVFNVASRHRWRALEMENEFHPTNVALVAAGMHTLVSKLDVEHPTKVEAHLVDYVQGKRESLPWSSPPEWKLNESPLLTRGRPTGSRLLSTSKDAPRVVEGVPVFATAAPTVPLTAVLQASATGEDPTLVILQQVSQGKIRPEVALPIVRLLCGGYSLPAQDLTQGGKTTHSSMEACEIRSGSAYVNGYRPHYHPPYLGHLLPVPRELMADVIDVLPQLTVEARDAVRAVMGSRKATSGQRARRQA